eukprot:SAG11_NODE_40389_length_202_cov_96.466019_1_plen_48_part_10
MKSISFSLNMNIKSSKRSSFCCCFLVVVAIVDDVNVDFVVRPVVLVGV